jgi:hypothetical protein
LYKYLPSKYIEAFVGRGELLFRSLSYFRNYEELKVRGDQNEGKRIFKPRAGLEITNTETGERLCVPRTFESGVRDRDIFVFCLSSVRSSDLSREFGADACVEILDPVALLAKVRTSLQLRKWVKGGLLYSPLDYYSVEDPPIAEWAVPERMVVRKTTEYSHQGEYRLAFARGDALKVNNVKTRITAQSGGAAPTLEGHPEHTLRIGSIKKLCRVH